MGDRMEMRKSRAALRLNSFFLAIFAAGLCGCSNWLDGVETVENPGSVRETTIRAMVDLSMDRAAPVLLRIYKQESMLEIWKQDRTGKFALLKAYPICKYSGTIGPKIREGDRQAPEGFYEVTREQMNPLSREYLSFDIGFPNAFDRSLARTGSAIMVHGGCRSIGCYAMTDKQMEEIYGLLDEAFKGGQEKVQLQAFPFRMTTENLAWHAKNPHAPFWAMLKEGSDAFLETDKPPMISVCGQRYVFNAAATNKDLNPRSPCPPGIGPAPLAEPLKSPEQVSLPAIPTEHLPPRPKILLSQEQFARHPGIRTLFMRREVAVRHNSAKAVFQNVKGQREPERHTRSRGHA